MSTSKKNTMEYIFRHSYHTVVYANSIQYKSVFYDYDIWYIGSSV